jgi:DNA-binding CsgD family transcriptional regulator
MTSNSPAKRSLPRLTKKQREVLALVADNRTSKEIAGLLSISESAVNQRIEIVRARLGGLPRGELARLYRLNFSTETPADDNTWQKIHLSESGAGSNGAATGSIQASLAAGSHRFGEAGLDGSQLSAAVPYGLPAWLSSEQRPMAMARVIIMIVIVIAALAVAILVTSLLGPGGGTQP